MAIILALVSSVLWGIADFAGGTATRALPAFVVVLASQTAGLIAVAVAATATGAWTDAAGYIPWAAGAGLAGAAGLLTFYHALAVGTMGVVSPIAALGVVVPVAAGLATGHLPSAVVAAGFVLAIAGVVAASGPERSAGRSLTPVVLAIIAAVCFGGALLFIARGAAVSPLMTMVGMRMASVSALAGLFLVRRLRGLGSAIDARGGTAAGPSSALRRLRTSARLWAIVMAAGLFDVSANLTFGLASTAGALTIVAVLGSVYPAVTVLLARVVHRELLTRTQQIGVTVAVVGVALIAGWS